MAHGVISPDDAERLIAWLSSEQPDEPPAVEMAKGSKPRHGRVLFRRDGPRHGHSALGSKKRAFHQLSEFGRTPRDLIDPGPDVLDKFLNSPVEGNDGPFAIL